MFIKRLFQAGKMTEGVDLACYEEPCLLCIDKRENISQLKIVFVSKIAGGWGQNTGSVRGGGGFGL